MAAGSARGPLDEETQSVGGGTAASSSGGTVRLPSSPLASRHAAKGSSALRSPPGAPSSPPQHHIDLASLQVSNRNTSSPPSHSNASSTSALNRGPQSPSLDGVSAGGDRGSTRTFPVRSVVSARSGNQNHGGRDQHGSGDRGSSRTAQTPWSDTRSSIGHTDSYFARRSLSTPQDSSPGITSSSIETPESPRGLSISADDDPLNIVDEKEVIERANRVLAARSVSDGDATIEAEPIFVTARFEHVETKDGHMILTGREGTPQACEDEPIHMPGAVQAFGVLIGIEVTDDDRLLVKQVSENSGFILGLPPNQLFGLSCFTDILSDDEADSLRENLDMLDEPGQADLIEVGPHHFKLTGRGIDGATLDGPMEPREWTCWCAAHKPDRDNRPNFIALELELENDETNPLRTDNQEPLMDEERGGMAGEPYEPTAEDLAESTVNVVRPLRGSQTKPRRARRTTAGATAATPSYLNKSSSSMDVFQVLTQVTEQLSRAEDLASFLKVVVGVIQELTGFHRVMIYQFDEMWNGQVVAELVDWTKTRDLYRGLHFPATDIPAQAREMYRISRVRYLYDRDQPTARMVCRDRAELEKPLNMTHCYSRAMSPIHIKYLANMGVRSSLSISIMAFGSLWGLISCHSYGRYGMRPSTPVRQICRLLADSVSRNIERLSYAQRLHTRKLINTESTNANPSGYIVAKAEDLLTLFEADYGVLSIGDEAKILGSLPNSQEALAVLEYLRMKAFTVIKASADLAADFDIQYPPGFEHIAGLLSVPLSHTGHDFIVFFRKGMLRQVHWAGNPYEKIIKEGTNAHLEPRKSFKLWSETIIGKSKTWTDEQLETASVLCLIYSKFIAVWRQKESALKSSQLTNLLLSNASHEVRTPLNQIVNYLEMALESQLDGETRDALSKSYNASRTLVHVINDLLDLTRTEGGLELYARDPFELPVVIEDAVAVHRDDAKRRGLDFEVIETPTGTPTTMLGDRAKVRLVVAALCANAVKYTPKGKITVEWGELQDSEALELHQRTSMDQIRIGIRVIDTGVGIPGDKLDGLFRDFEEVDVTTEDNKAPVPDTGMGLGLAMVARVVRTLGGVMQAQSTVNVGSTFSLSLVFQLPSGRALDNRTALPSSADVTPVPSALAGQNRSETGSDRGSAASTHSSQPIRRTGSRSSTGSGGSSQRSEIDSLVQAMSAPAFGPGQGPGSAEQQQSLLDPAGKRRTVTRPAMAPRRQTTMQPGDVPRNPTGPTPGMIAIEDSSTPLRPIRVQAGDVEIPESRYAPRSPAVRQGAATFAAADPAPAGSSNPTALSSVLTTSASRSPRPGHSVMRVLVVEDDKVNRQILVKKLTKDGHSVVQAEHGREAVDLYREDRNFDIILMDLQMPVLDGLEASRAIRELEEQNDQDASHWFGLPVSHRFNGGRIPIIAVTASLYENQRGDIADCGIDGWALKPLNFVRIYELMHGAISAEQREKDIYVPGRWNQGGWLSRSTESTDQSFPPSPSPGLYDQQTPRA